MTRNQRILQALKESGKSQADLATMLGVTRATVSERLANEKEIDSYDFLIKVAQLTNKSLSWLVTGKDKTMVVADETLPNVQEPLVPVKKGITAQVAKAVEAADDFLSGKVIRPIMVTVDRSGKELISYVPVKAQAGYARGYSDERYIEKLPAFSLPNFQDHGTFRMFQVSGDSMRQLGGGGLQDGDVVIAQYVEDFFAMKDNMVYVIVSTDGIVIKRVINRLSTTDKMLVLKSDNKNGDYPNVIMHANKIVEVWEYKAHISRQLNFATDLFEMINEIQVQQAKLAQRVDEMDSKTRAIIKNK